MTNNVNNTGIDKVKSYLQSLGVDTSKLTQSQMQSIFAQADASGDGKISQGEFSAAVSDVLGADLDKLTAAEDEFLDAWEDIAGIDGDKETISEEDLKELGLNEAEGSDAPEAPENAGGSSGGGNGGGGNPPAPDGSNNDGLGAGNGVQPANITGDETAAQLNQDKAAQVAKLDEVRAGTEMQAAHKDMNAKEETYKGALEALEETAGEHKEELENLNKTRDLAEEAVDKHETEVVKVAEEDCKTKEDAYNEAKTATQTAQTNLNAAKSEVSSLQGSEPPTEIQVGTDEEGNPIMGPNPAHAQWVTDLAAAQEKVSEAETALTEAKEKETTAQEDVEKAQEAVEQAQASLIELQKAVTTADENIAQFLMDTGLAETEAGQAVTAALGEYDAARQTYEAAQAQRNADMKTLRENIHKYDTAIDEANAREKEEADAKYEEGKEAREKTLAEHDTESGEPLVKPEEEECIADPIGFEFKDQDGNDVDLKLVTDDGAFDSVSDFLGTAEGGISALTDLAGDDGIVDATELANAGIKFATVIDGKATALSFEEIKEKFGVDNIQIDVSKIDPNYQGDQEFGVNVSVGKYNKKTKSVEGSEEQKVTGYSTYQTAEEIKAMNGYGALVGDYNDTYRDENGVLLDLPDEFRGSGYEKYIHVDENGNYYVSIDTDEQNWNTNGKNDDSQNGETLDEIITGIYKLDPSAPDYKTTLESLKAAIKLVNSPEQKSGTNATDGSIYIYGNQGVISENSTEDGAKLLLVDKDAALELVGEGSDWYKKSVGNTNYRDWADEAAKQTDLINSLTANQGYTRDSEGRIVLDETSEEFTDLVSGLTQGVIDEDGNVTQNPETVWHNTDFSQYSPETIIKLAQAFENNVEADGRTFLDAAQYYCGNGQDTQALNDVTNAIMSKAGNDIVALDLITRELDSAIANGDTESLSTLMNAAENNQLDMQAVLKKYSNLHGGETVDKALEKLNIDVDALNKYKETIKKCENAQDSSATRDLVKQLGSSTDATDADLDGSTLSTVAEKAWKNLNVESMTPEQVLNLQKEYDLEFGEGAFEAKYKEVFGETKFDTIMDGLGSGTPISGANKETPLSNGKTVETVINGLNYANGIKELGNLNADDLATIAAVYDEQNGEGAFRTFMETQQTEFDVTKSYQIERKLAEANAAIAEAEEQGAKTDNLQSYLDRITNPSDYLRPGDLPDDDYYLDIISDAMAELDNISDPMAIFEKLKEENPSLLKAMDENDTLDGYYLDMLTHMANNDASVDEIIDLDNRYKELTNKSRVELSLSESDAKTYIDTVIGLYNGATPEDIAKLNETFNPLELISSTFEDQAIVLEKTEDLLTNLFGQDSGKFLSDYRKDFNETYKEYGETFDEFFEREFGEVGDPDTFINVLQRIGDGVFTTPEDAKAALLHSVGGDIGKIVEYFNNETVLSADAAETYMPVLMNIFQGSVPNDEDGSTVGSNYLEPTEPESEWAKEFTDADTLKYIELLEDNAAKIEMTAGDSNLATDNYNATQETPVLIAQALEDPNVPVEDKLAILEKMSETNPDAISTFLYGGVMGNSYRYDEQGNVIHSHTTINAMLNDMSGDIETIERFNNILNDLTGSETGLNDYISILSDNTEFTNTIISLYKDATPSEVTRLNSMFDMRSLIQDVHTGDDETALVQQLFENVLTGLPTDKNAYITTSAEKDRLEMLADSNYVKGSTTQKVEKILQGYKDGNLSANEAAYLLQSIAPDADSLADMAQGFREIKDKKEEELLPVFLEIFGNTSIK